VVQGSRGLEFKMRSIACKTYLYRMRILLGFLPFDTNGRGLSKYTRKRECVWERWRAIRGAKEGSEDEAVPNLDVSHCNPRRRGDGRVVCVNTEKKIRLEGQDICRRLRPGLSYTKQAWVTEWRIAKGTFLRGAHPVTEEESAKLDQEGDGRGCGWVGGDREATMEQWRGTIGMLGGVDCPFNLPSICT